MITHTVVFRLRRPVDSDVEKRFHETVRAFERRLSNIVDPRERDHAQQAALVLIKTTLQQWSQNPPVRH
ncbi:MAG: hypothetical protein IE935_08915 [Micrococcales bacterium]|nr:hypothetical protein [Micrococcales bacterium]